MTRGRRPAAFASVALALSLAACGRADAPGAAGAAADPGVKPGYFTVPPSQLAHLRIGAARLVAWPVTVRTTGTVDFDGDHTTQVITQAGGPITRIMVDLGAAVKPGDPLLYVSSPDLTSAVSAYRKAAKDYPGTAAAAEADKRARMFLDDPATRAALARQQMDSYCRRMLEMGELYERNNRDDEAIVRYRSILAAYPDSDWADEAQKRLNELERRHLK